MTGKKGMKDKLSQVREHFNLCFEQVGGMRSFKKWAKENPTTFYTLYAKLAPKEVKQTTRNETHEDFIKIMMEREQKKIEGKGKPLKLIEAN
jgi:predicted transcriptional regulator